MTSNGTYLDYAAGAPLRPEVREAMHKAEEAFGNPGALHSFGQEAQAIVDSAREKIAKILEVNFRDLIFTGSATEANNLIIRGILENPKAPQRIIISAVEHDSVFETAQQMKKRGVEVEIVPVSKTGEVLEEEFKKLLIKPVALVSIIAGQNEIGTVQNLNRLAELVREVREESGYPLIHTDAVQAFSYLTQQELKTVDAVTLSAHKLGGPKGVGLLVIEEKLREKFLTPQLTGGSQEFGLRAGTEDPIRLAGFATAMEVTSLEKEELNKKLIKLKTEIISGLRDIFPDLKINGRPDLAHILNIHFPYRQAEDFLVALDLVGIAVSAGSACSARAQKPSRTLLALGLSGTEAKESLRFSLGWASREEDVEKLITEIGKMVSKN
jgi:cysteine desulfurase